MQTKHTFIFTLLLGLGWAGFLFAYQNGPDPGVNGILGAGTACNQAGCHVGNPLNAAGGTLTLSGLPAGDSRPDNVRAGKQSSTRGFATGKKVRGRAAFESGGRARAARPLPPADASV